MASARTGSAVPLMIVCLLLAVAGTGCSRFRSSLATSTGPTKEGRWSVAREQWAHVGEQVDFSYVLLGGTADYALLEIEPVGIREVNVGADPTRFWFENRQIRFNHPTPPAQPLRVRITAYRQRDERDYMSMDGQLLTKLSPYDVKDVAVADAEIRLHVYQSQVALTLPADPAGFDWETARLSLYPDPDRPVEIRAERAYRKGFRVVGPDAAGEYMITYSPTHEQVRRTGQTPVAFTVLNAAGVERRVDMLIDTP